MKKLILIFTFYLLCQNLNAQSFFVGDTSCNYIRLDTNIHTLNPGTWGAWSSNKSYGIDCDLDLAIDIIFTKNNYGVNTGSGTWEQKRLSCTSSTGVQFVYKTGTVSCVAGPSNLLDSLIPGTILNNSLNWSDTLPNSCLYDIRYSATSSLMGCGYFFIGFNPFNNYKGVFIGFRKILTGDTIYGWIHLYTQIPYGSYEITSMAYKHTLSNNTVTPVFTNTVSAICLGDQMSLTASPSGGLFTGTGVSGNIFNSTVSGTGNWNVYYYNGCTNPAALNITVNPCVGINELKHQETYFAIFPNPNAGEFEIKSIKEVTITITNELGQLIKTVQLNSGSNYSSKISELQSGVYFIGNKFSRQKIVVIK